MNLQGNRSMFSTTRCVRAKPIAALAALKLGSLALPSTHSDDPHGRGECRRCREHSPAGYEFYWEWLLHSQYFRRPWRSQSRAARSKLDSSP